MAEDDDRGEAARARFTRAVELHAAGRFAEAAQAYAEVIELAPRVAAAWSNLGLALLSMNDPAQAVVALDAAVAIDPGFVDGQVNRAIALRQLGQPKAALAACDRALALAPGHPAAVANRSTCALLLGDFQAGFRDQEARWLVEPNRSQQRRFEAPLWLGEAPVAGRTILLHAEQGFGDTLQFARYAPLVHAMGARVILQVQPALTSVLASLAGVDQLIGLDDPEPPFDLHCPLMSLPLALGTRPDTIPNPARYLTAPPERIERWAAALGPRTRPRVGLVWSGNPDHLNDFNRSIPFARFADALPQGVEAVSLQETVREGDAAALAAQPGVRRFDGRIADFGDTAALASLMDVVVSVDTAVAHLAAALGRPTWILTPFAPDWRWLAEGRNSAWYPSVTLYRQPALGDWIGPLAEIRQALEALAL